MINHVTVIGSGLMGAGIAAHLTNAGVNVLLLDIPDVSSKNRNNFADQAVKKLPKIKPSPLTLARNTNLIETGNIDDHLHLIKNSDWVIEVIIEDLNIKKSLYEKIEDLMKDDLIVSSNTSTIPLKKLTEGRNSKFKSNFFITHFFNPPRYLKLLEIVSSEKNNINFKEIISKFCDIKLGKTVIDCKDTPGFIGNRIGVFWMMSASIKAIKMGLSVEEADLIISSVFGAPKTGVFGLLDVVGLDLMPHVLSSMIDNLESNDEYHLYKKIPEIFNYMLENKLIGRKGIGGFYKLESINGKKIKKSINLSTKKFSESKKPTIDSLKIAKKDLVKFFEIDNIYSKYAWSVLSDVILYTLNHTSEISNDITSVDSAMKNGFGLEFGPFELIDKLGKSWIENRLLSENKTVPTILNKLSEEKFYKVEEGKLQYYDFNKNFYKDFDRPEGVLILSDIKKSKKPIEKISTASLWDIDDGVTVFEIHSRGNSIDMNTMQFLSRSIDIVNSSYKAMIIYNEGSMFSAGANVGEALFLGNIGLESELVDNIVENGQKVYKKLKYSKFPVISAPSGMALGGGCEILLHSNFVQAHVESYIGLTEAALGICPAWGGCKELLNRFQDSKSIAKGPMPAIMQAFNTIGLAKTSTSAPEAQKIGFLNDRDGITMNRDRLLYDAKMVALKMIYDFTPPEKPSFRLPGKTAFSALELGLNSMKDAGQISEHDKFIGEQIANVLSGGDTDMLNEVDEDQILKLESSAIQTLFKEPKSQERIEKLLETGKIIRN